jgi:CheY-like chemotaxis protein
MTTDFKVLIVEDEAILRTAYTIVLESKGFKVAASENGQEAILQLESYKPDLILLDMLMPVMGGKEFLIQSNILTIRPNIKVIAYSNLSDQATVKELLALGVHEHLLKSSMSPNELVAHIEALLR